jgi:signal peptidase I
MPVYGRAIRSNKLVIKDDKVFINDKEATTYTFKMNYYWMMGATATIVPNWGFVPEDVGKALFVWMSWDDNAPFSVRDCFVPRNCKGLVIR